MYDLRTPALQKRVHMPKYVCVEDRQIGDNLYVAGEQYTLTEDLVNRYASYFELEKAKKKKT